MCTFLPPDPGTFDDPNLSLAALEQLVHFNPDRLPDDLTAYALELPDDLNLRRVEIEELPEQWNRGAEIPALRHLGGEWAHEEKTPVLSVPSAVIPEERNYLINPRHAAAAEVHVVRQRLFTVDPRLFE